MKTTVKRLWEKYPDATFVFWYGELPLYHKKFTDPKELERTEYNIPFEIGLNTDINEFMDLLKSCNKIYIDGSELREKLKELVNGI